MVNVEKNHNGSHFLGNLHHHFQTFCVQKNSFLYNQISAIIDNNTNSKTSLTRQKTLFWLLYNFGQN